MCVFVFKLHAKALIEACEGTHRSSGVRCGKCRYVLFANYF